MPQPRSARFDQVQATPHIPVTRVDILDGGGNIIQRDVPILPDGNVVADRNAANTFIRQVSIPLGALSTAAATELQSNLADTYIQTYRGIRYQDTEVLGLTYNSAATWTPTNGGVMVGVTVNGSGQLQLGP